MAFNSKTSYQIYYEEQCKIYKQKGIIGNEAAKLIGKQWSSLTPLEKKPYDDKKKEYEQQMQREQKVMKDFQKKSQQEVSSKTNTSQKNSNDEKQSSQQKQENIKKFMKEDLQKEKQDTHKKVVIKKLDSQGKVLSTNSQQPQTQVKQAEKQKSSNQQQKNSQTNKVAEQKIQNNNNQEKNIEKTKEQQQFFQMNSEQEKLRKSNHQVYIDFYKERLAFYQKRFPQRKASELTQAIKEEWNCVKLQSKIQQKSKKKEEKQSKEVKTVQKEGKKIIEINGNILEVPRKPLSGYLRYYKEVQHKLKSKNPELAQNEIAKLASEQWNNLPKDQQEQYNSQYHKELLEYNNKIKEIKQKYNIVPSVASKKKINKSSKNFIMVNDQKVFYPLRLGGYFVYQRIAREQLSKQNHNRDSREISSIIGQTWKQMSELEKQQYEKQSEVEYQEQKRNFIEKYGKFPEQEVKIKQKPAEKVQQSQPKKINEKRKAPSQKAQKEVSNEEKEEQFMKKYERKMRINYDDVESEIEDIFSDIEKDQKKKQVRVQYQHDADEEDEIQDNDEGREQRFEDIEKQSTKNKKVKTEKRSSSSVTKPASVSKQTNRLYEMLKQPIQAPEDFEFQFS
ncbi:hypothetical protein ABPG74_012066 [Tetrahymena malaccensis]